MDAKTEMKRRMAEAKAKQQENIAKVYGDEAKRTRHDSMNENTQTSRTFAIFSCCFALASVWFHSCSHGVCALPRLQRALHVGDVLERLWNVLLTGQM